MIRTANFQPVKYPANRHSIGGTLAVAAKRGQIVVRTSATAVGLATGKAGFFLTRDVIDNDDGTALTAYHDADELRPNKAGFQTPFVKGGSVQAEELAEVWVEGTDLLHSSLDENTTVGTKVTTNGGKFAELTDSEAQECMGVIRVVDAAVNAASPAKRFLIEIIKSTVNIPAA